MTAYDRLDLLFQQNNGIVKTAQVLEIGIAKSTFYAYAKQRGVEQVAHGVYVSPDAWTDAMYLLHLRCAQAVFSHESALFFHDLTDREPSPYSITVKTGYNPASLQADGIKVYTIKKELHDVGIVKNYRKQMQCFRHCTDEAIAERKTYSEEQKTFLVDYGLTIVKAIHELIK